MRYYLIVGEASGDLHASHLMLSLKKQDTQAEFRFFGGDMMTAVGGTRVRHYKELAYMGFIPVLLHLPVILRNMKMCQQDILQWQPDVVILVDYPGFNLKIAKFVKAKTQIPVYYYISPKIWAWKEYRIKNIKRDVDELFSILPFEVDFFEKKHHYPIHYVGNPTAQEVREWQKEHHSSSLISSSKTIALLAGSRKQEIKDNLPAMIAATKHLAGNYDIVLAGAPSIERSYYEDFLRGSAVRLVENETYQLLSKATAALVTSGTATLETAMFRVPQVVCYETPIPQVIAFLKKHFLKVRYISLVNLIADKEVVPELVADTFSVENIRAHLEAVLPGGAARQLMLDGYEEVHRRLGESRAPDVAAQLICKLIIQKNN
ncbi:MAG: lipid-A-disaccharide synthase [Prevotella sp.]|nr:lipid-A-disaccharide synthase [Prevotella sp.]MBQ8152397.1 lipid-A-disaccharide synthase [Prevotella sp.]